MDGERRAHMNEVHIQDAPDNLPPNNVRGQYPCGGCVRYQNLYQNIFSTS